MSEIKKTLWFRSVRHRARDRLREVIYDDDGLPVLCRWQGDEGCNVPVYCNLHDHLRVLEDLLAHGTWCDGAGAGDREGHEALYRYFTLVAWAVEQCLDDMEILLESGQVVNMRKLSKKSRALKGFVNNVWKHRDSAVGQSGTSVHGCLHHGPYYFEDDPGLKREDVSADCVLTVDSFNTITEAPCSALVPKLDVFVEHVADELGRVMCVLDDSDARERVRMKWGECNMEATV